MRIFSGKPGRWRKGEKKDFWLLLSISGLYSMSVALSNTFVNVFLWRQTGDMFRIGLYNFMIVLMQPVAFYFAGLLAKRSDRANVLRIGVFLLALYYLAVFLSGKEAFRYLLALGALLGTAYGFYWLAYNVLTFEITEPDTRDLFNGFSGVAGAIGELAGPIAAGSIISRFAGYSGYTIVFSLSLGLFIAGTILSFFLKKRPNSGHYFFFTALSMRNSRPKWKYVTNANFFQGLREGIFAFAINIHVYLTAGNEMGLGGFAFVRALVSFLAYFLIGRKLKKKFRNRAIFLGGSVLALSTLLIIKPASFSFLLFYAAVVAASYPLVLVPFFSITFDVIGKNPGAAEWRIEYVAVRELFLNLGRFFSIGIFLLFLSFFPYRDVFPILLTVFGSGYFFIYFCTKKIEAEERGA